MKKATLLLGVCALAALVAAGCGSQDASLSKDDQQNFKGKPMPPEVRAKLQGQMGKAGGAPPPGR